MKEYVTLGGDYSGQRFDPLPWFEKFLRAIYGHLNDDGERLVQEAYAEVPKGNAKTTGIAAIAVMELVRAPHSGTEIYSAATQKSQAANTYRAAEQMVNNDSRLSARLKCVPNKNKIYRRDDPTSFYIALSADGDKHDGFVPQIVIRDELHVWRTERSKKLYTVLEKSAYAKRKNPLIIDITTAGEMDKSELCWKRHEYARQVIEGTFKNPRFHGMIYAANQKKMEEDPTYWMTREARLEANPAHEENGGHIKDAIFADMVTKAIGNKLDEAEYKRYQLNYWGTDVEAVIDYPVWLKCGGGIDMRQWPKYDFERAMSEWGLIGNPCILGLDMGSSKDLTALAAVFPPHGNRTRWAFLLWYWMPKSAITVRRHEDQVPYHEWAEAGFITAHDQPATSSLMVLPQIRYCMQMFHVGALCYDDWNADSLIQRIVTGNEEGEDVIPLEVKDVDQSLKQLNEPTKWLVRQSYHNDLIQHGNNPVLNWNARNLSVQIDSNNNMKPKKPGDKNPKKIDGLSAVVNALRLGLVAAPKVPVDPVVSFI